MFCLNEEDEEDDLLETITGRVCFIHFLPKFISAHHESLQKKKKGFSFSFLCKFSIQRWLSVSSRGLIESNCRKLECNSVATFLFKSRDPEVSQEFCFRCLKPI